MPCWTSFLFCKWTRISQFNSVVLSVSSDELANDVTGAEALLERHQEYRTEIDSRAGTFLAFESFGNQLLNSQHYASDDIKLRLNDVNESRKVLEE